MWGDKCAGSSGDSPCEYYDSLDDTTNLDEYKRQYILEWEAYIHHWRGNDKWGDTYDEL